MPRRTQEARTRYSRRAMARRAEREVGRLIVPLASRRVDFDPDDESRELVDYTAIDLALRHWTRYAAQLSRAELAEAVRIGLSREITGPDLAELLCLREWEIRRLRAQFQDADQATSV